METQCLKTETQTEYGLETETFTETQCLKTETQTGYGLETETVTETQCHETETQTEYGLETETFTETVRKTETQWRLVSCSPLPSPQLS